MISIFPSDAKFLLSENWATLPSAGMLNRLTTKKITGASKSGSDFVAVLYGPSAPLLCALSKHLGFGPVPSIQHCESDEPKRLKKSESVVVRAHCVQSGSIIGSRERALHAHILYSSLRHTAVQPDHMYRASRLRRELVVPWWTLDLSPLPLLSI